MSHRSAYWWTNFISSLFRLRDCAMKCAAPMASGGTTTFVLGKHADTGMKWKQRGGKELHLFPFAEPLNSINEPLKSEENTS